MLRLSRVFIVAVLWGTLLLGGLDFNLLLVPLKSSSYNLVDMFLLVDEWDWDIADYPELAYCITSIKKGEKKVFYPLLTKAILSAERLTYFTSDVRAHVVVDCLDQFYTNLSLQDLGMESAVAQEVKTQVQEYVPKEPEEYSENKITRNPSFADRLAFVNIVMSDQGELKFRELAANGTNSVSLQAPSSLTADYTITLPPDDGAPSQVLQTDGSGLLGWASASDIPDVIINGGNTEGAGITIGTNDNFGLSFETNNANRIQIANSGGITVADLASVGIVHTNGSGLLSTSLIVNADVDAAAGIVDTKLATISTSGKVANSATTATSANTASAIVARDGSGGFSAASITAESSVQFEETGTGTDTVTVQAPASLAAAYTLTWPVDDGVANQVLLTDGSGGLSWGDAALDGGNSLGTTLILGTNDAQSVELETNGTSRLFIDASGNTTYTTNYRAHVYL